MKLIIVESPTKAKTISRFIGRGFKVESSYGHVRDLPKSKLAIDVEHDFKPQYVIPKKAKETVKKLKSEAEKADAVIMATDEDREGEAIAWHLTRALGLEEPKDKTVERIVFHEITKKAIEEALKNPRDIDLKLVDAQQARRILDRLVGYKLSPFLWKKIMRGLSAGRVQSVALRILVEREREIKSFRPEEYYTISAKLQKPARSGSQPSGKRASEFEANLIKINEKALEKFDLKTKDEAEKITKELEKKAEWSVLKIEKKAVTRNPLPPFTTSTIQQEAWSKFHFSAKQTMIIAQQLYEGLTLGEEGQIGLITYMRTDSVNLSEESLKSAKEFLEKKFGDNYALPAPRRFKTKSKRAQEAHEAIRPADINRTPESIKQYLEPRQHKLYDLIWKRFVATQMPPAIFDATAVDALASPEPQTETANEYTFRATGSVLKFDGFLKIYPVKFEEVSLPELSPQEKLNLIEIQAKQHFTEPLPRYTEASLVRALEKFGIGRPSTYAPTMSTIQERGYAQKDPAKHLVPTEIGEKVNDLLVEHFPEIVDVDFTAKMEESLDEIAEGKKQWVPIIKEFYEPFEKNLKEKYESVAKEDMSSPTDEICELCKRPMVIRYGRYGKFLACSGFPECKNTKQLPPTSLHIACPECLKGEIVERKTRKGRFFYGCSRYPECKFASWYRPVDEKCPKCSSILVDKSKTIACSSKECDYKKDKES